MVTAEFRREGTYIIRWGDPERHLVDEIAKAYCIPKEDAVVAIVNRGMDSITGQLKENPVKDGESHGCPHSG